MISSCETATTNTKFTKLACLSIINCNAKVVFSHKKKLCNIFAEKNMKLVKTLCVPYTKT